MVPIYKYTCWKWFCIHKFLYKREKEIVKFLIENWANVYTYGNTAFNESCKNGYIEITKLIIQSDINYFKNNTFAKKIIYKYNLKDDLIN